MTDNLTLHDLFGVPFTVKLGDTELLATPPTIMFFESLLKRYNLGAAQVEHRIGRADTLDARIETVVTITQLMHVSLDMANPNDGWTLERVMLLVQNHPEFIGSYMESFKRFLPKGSGGSAKKVKNPNPKAVEKEPHDDWAYLIKIALMTRFDLNQIRLMSLRGIEVLTEEYKDLQEAKAKAMKK